MDSPADHASHLRVTLRACQACSQSKAKCVPATELTEGKCLRCFKTGRECSFPDRSAKKRKAPSSTTAELEERIQNLASLLAKQQQAAFTSGPSTPEGQTTVGPTSSFQTNNPPRNLPSGPQDPWLDRVPHRPNTEVNNPLPQSRLDSNTGDSTFATRTTPITGNTLHDKDGEYFLKIYREHFSRRFPFIVIPPTISAKEFQAQRPWLFKAVTLAASQDNRAQQLILAQELITDLALAMVIKAEKSLDMLQGLVIQIVRCTVLVDLTAEVYRFPRSAIEIFLLMFGKQQTMLGELSKPPNTKMAILICFVSRAYSVASCSSQINSTGHSFLTISMVFDLGLNRTIGDSDMPEMLGNSSQSFGNENHKNVTRSMEERRTLLSVYFLTSMISWSLKRMEGLQFSPYLEHCRRFLLEHAEYESDVILAALVKIQSIVGKTNRLILDKDYPGGEKVPVWMHSKLAILELHAFWESLSPGVRQNEILATNHLCAQIALYESCLQKLHFPRDLANGNVQRLNMLHACLDVTRKLIERCLARPISDYFTFCVIDIGTMGLACSSLFKLSLVDEIGWDLVSIRQSVSFRDYFERFRINLEQVGLAIDKNQREPCKPSFFTSGGTKMKMVQSWYEVKLAKEGQPIGSLPQNMTELMNVEDLAILGDRFWEDFMVDGGFV